MPQRLMAVALGALVFVASARAEKPRLAPSRPGSPELRATIRDKDAALFAAVFDRCDFDAIAALVTPDFEFYHDQWGQTADSGAAFVESIRNLCARQARGEDPKSRRELVADSVFVQPLGDYGAIETGVHRFYRLAPGEADTLAGEARFAHVWKKDGTQWRLARVLSYEHAAAVEP